MPHQFIRTDLQDGCFTLTLARPPVNVLHAPMMAEIGAALDEAAARPEVRVLVLTGRGQRVFSGGVEIADHGAERIGALMQDFGRLLRRLTAFPLPTVAALNGAALGGGLELALACDMMVAVPEARLGHPEIKLAAIAFPGILMLQGRLPPNRITELLAGGELMDAAEALRLGLLNRVLAANTFDAELAAFTAPFTRLSRPVLQLMMRSLKIARGRTLDSGFDELAHLYVDELLPLADAAEGLAAYAARRAPVWQHR
ncbi:MAG: enoyl-CoA hydratase/isomerase family protein [Rubrivivax sp.]